jgi:DNA-binding HxlR family transcriptional regulator
MVRGFKTFKEFQGSGEGIATNILAHRLRRLEETGIIRAEVDETDGRRAHYRLTEKGLTWRRCFWSCFFGKRGMRIRGHPAQ